MLFLELIRLRDDFWSTDNLATARVDVNEILLVSEYGLVAS